MKILLLLLATLACAFDNPWRFVYETGCSLANHQERLIARYRAGDSVSDYEVRTLKINYWVRTAEKLAPGNLVIRQYCLIDLFEKKPGHRKQITKLVNTISGGSGPLRSWSESYTYWNYTKDIFYPWLERFPDTTLSRISQEIERGFAATAYLRANEWRPAPFGDLFDYPLDFKGQELANGLCRPCDSITVKNIHRECSSESVVRYTLQPMPMGLNGHPDKTNSSYTITDGIPVGFTYYVGYKLKYKDQKAEWTDLLSPIRLLSVPFIW